MPPLFVPVTMRIARRSAGPLILLAAFLLVPPAAGAAEAAGCPERPACTGCGCKGGPGYRGPDGRCVGFRELAKVCGDPPDRRCVFENAPGTGLNRECATAPSRKREGAAAPPN
ncbi:hypothetical protein GCM10007301_55880 [Azorhizobium oxalatiphilum]|uniref:Uncharacterized protein n=1 Tax=Azorhizobium oxalatiphilum TaxID=980631 RepID=A0A917FKW7_9HYPH|nr:hypothetical protein GCM10007301_55880 [Azorhizobium oxalatiphilum]